MTIKKLPKAVIPEEFPLIIKATRKEDESKLAFLLAYGAGLRLAEVKALKPENIQEKTIMVWSGKGGKDRVVPRPKGWKDWMTKKLPIKKSTRSLQRNFKTACKKAKLNPLYTFHSLRHGFATRLIESGVPISHVQSLMGHSDISTTGIYLKARPMDALKSYEEFF